MHEAYAISPGHTGSERIIIPCLSLSWALKLWLVTK